VQCFSDGVLDCDVSDFKPSPSGFPAQVADLSMVRKLLLFVDGDKVLELAEPKPKPKPPPKPVARPSPPPRPRSRKRRFPSEEIPASPPEVIEEEVCFKVPEERVRFAEGRAEVEWGGRLPRSGRFVRLDVAVENSFVSKKLNCIKSYLARCMGGDAAFRVTVRVRGGKAEVVKAESDSIADILRVKEPKHSAHIEYLAERH